MQSNSRNYWKNAYNRYPGVNTADYDGWLDAHADGFYPGCRVLDLGCGAGTDIVALLGFGASVTAADFSPEAMAMVQAAFGGCLNAADCFDMRCGLPYADASFDAVVSDLSLHYFSLCDTMYIADEIRRILQPGGLLLARVHSIHNLPGSAAEKLDDGYYIVDGIRRRYFTPDEIKKLFSDWHIDLLLEKEIHRYGRIKHVIEFAVRSL